jgi:integrase
MIPLLPGLQDVLAEHRAIRPHGAEEPVVPTRNGTRNTQNNVLSRIVVPVHAEANGMLSEREQEPIEHLTPHTLRRTFASILALCEVHPRRARQRRGHEDSRTAANIYEQDIDDRLRRRTARGSPWLRSRRGPRVFAKRRVSVAKPSQDAKRPAEAGLEALLGE